MVSWVQEYHRHYPVSLMIHVENFPEGENPKAEVEKAVHNYFAYRAKLNRREFKHMMKRGRMSLLIGVAFLTICLLMGNLITGWADAPFSPLLREAFLIAGWVAMWRPMQISVRLAAIATARANLRKDEPNGDRIETDTSVKGPEEIPRTE